VVRADGADAILRAQFTYQPTRTTHTDSLGHRWRYEVNTAGQIVAYTDPAGARTVQTWDRYHNATGPSACVHARPRRNVRNFRPSLNYRTNHGRRANTAGQQPTGRPCPIRSTDRKAPGRGSCARDMYRLSASGSGRVVLTTTINR
jgi:hypothetical protein